jgi:uncharacterized membrane protein YqjE
MASRHGGPDDAPPGLIAGIAALVKNSVGLLLSRVELAAIELGELRGNLARLLMIAALGIVILLFAVGSWTALIVVLAWDALGWKILFLVAMLYSAGAVALLAYARVMVARKVLALPATMAELRKDRDALL